ncbi:hypothetical protein GCM10010411_19920 [Actinomadura fulvescens]|uniref:Secreted protein n=1 Tax=Actinomadura fulvescens TaxID=46160 RepID=A0ABN3PJC8_9ACTN
MPLMVAGATLVPATTASAAPVAREAAAPAFAVDRGIGVIPARNLISGVGRIRDLTAGNDAVAVQTFIQRRVGNRWVDVVRGRRVAGNNVATSRIAWRRCANGKVYRVKVNFNYKNRVRGSRFTAAVVC